MPTGQGFNSKAALGKESAWGTGVALTEVLPMTSEDFNRQLNKIMNSYLDATVSHKRVQSTVIGVNGTLNLEAVHDVIAGDIFGIGNLLLGALGVATWEAIGGRNQYTLANTVANYYTLAFEKNVSVWEMQGCKINTLEFSGEAGGVISLAAGIVAKDLLRTGDAGIVNASGAFTALINTTEPKLLQMDDCVIRIDVHGAVLAGADQVNVSGFKLSLNNNLKADDYATPLTGESGDTILEPIRNGKFDVDLELTFPRYTSDSEFGWLNADTPVQCDIKFLLGTDEFNVYLPNCEVMEAGAPIPGAEIFPKTVKLKALHNGTTNTDMAFEDATAITGAIGIETKNERTGVPA